MAREKDKRRARTRAEPLAKPTPKSKSKEEPGPERGIAVSKLLTELRRRNIERAKVGGFDLDGVLRGKYISLAKLESALGSGFGFCDVIFGWDMADQLYDNATVTGWDTGYPDAHATLDPATVRYIPWEPGVASLLCDFQQADGRAHPACPRSLLKKVLERAAGHGLQAKFGAEFEFFFFQEGRDELARKGYRSLTPLDPGMFGYSWVRTGQDAELMRDLWEGCAQFGIQLEGLHTETGPGVYEAAIAVNEPLELADQAALFKTSLKQIAHRHGISVTFMAKCDARLPGASGHLHQSLWKGGKNAFYDDKRPRGMSQLMEHYVAGQMHLMRDWTALYSPTVNSYKRYVPGLWAPLVASWGIENRTCAIRIVAPSDPKALRVEYRQTAADINPYVAIAACLGAGLYGIEQRLELPQESVGDAGTDGPQALPRTLSEAAQRLAHSDAAKDVLGAPFVDHYVRTRDWEARQYQQAVTDWELQRYFETV